MEANKLELNSEKMEALAVDHLLTIEVMLNLILKGVAHCLGGGRDRACSMAVVRFCLACRCTNGDNSVQWNP